ncbi:hypothetical protein D3C73_1556130 [compost metagenome]
MILEQLKRPAVPLFAVLSAFAHKDRHVPLHTLLQIGEYAFRIGITPVFMELEHQIIINLLREN